jgi:hypothetical protein
MYSPFIGMHSLNPRSHAPKTDSSSGYPIEPLTSLIATLKFLPVPDLITQKSQRPFGGRLGAVGLQR